MAIPSWLSTWSKSSIPPSENNRKIYVQLVHELIDQFLSFNITYIHREMNGLVDKLASYVANEKKNHLRDCPKCPILYTYRPTVPDNDESYKVFENDEQICSFLLDDEQDPLCPEVIRLKDNVYPKGLVPSENLF